MGRLFFIVLKLLLTLALLGAVLWGAGFLLFRLLLWNRSGAGKGLPEATPAP